jgi:hypothetical protein
MPTVKDEFRGRDDGVGVVIRKSRKLRNHQQAYAQLIHRESRGRSPASKGLIQLIGRLITRLDYSLATLESTKVIVQSSVQVTGEPDIDRSA